MQIEKIAFLLHHNPVQLLRILGFRLRPLPGRAVSKKINGVIFEFDFDYDPAIKSMYQETYETYTVETMRRLIRPGSVFIDVGASIGYLSAIAMGLVGKEGQVHSFEPVPKYFTKLKNIALSNKERKTTVNQCALGDKEGMAAIDVTSLACIGWNTIVPGMMKPETKQETVEVPIMRLDSYIKKRGIKNISLIKIDTEGYEFPVLKGLAGYFETDKVYPPIICEIAPDAYPLLGSTLSDLAGYMRKFDYRAFSLMNLDAEIDIAKLKETTDVVFMSGG